MVRAHVKELARCQPRFVFLVTKPLILQSAAAFCCRCGKLVRLMLVSVNNMISTENHTFGTRYLFASNHFFADLVFNVDFRSEPEEVALSPA